MTMPDLALLGVVLSLVAVNATMLGILLKVVLQNGKPKKAGGNPHATNPDNIRIGDMSLAFYKTECVQPIIEAIENRGGS